MSDGHDQSRWRVLVVAPVAAAQMLLAALAASQPALALGLIAGVLVVAAALLAPLVLLIGAFPATFVYWRVGPASIDMSVADALTMLGALAALPFVPWRSPTLRKLLIATLGYAAVLLLTVIAHPATRSLVEVFHRTSMVVGALLIGAAVARLGQVRLALRAFLAAAGVISVVAALDTLAHHLQPAYPFGIQKNAAGELIVMGLVILLAVPRRVGLSRVPTAVLATILLVGLAASEARGPALALVAVFAIHLLRQRRRGGASRIVRMAPLLLAASIILIGISVVTYRDRDLSVSTEQFNSLNTRLDTYHYAIEDVWRPHLLDGSGLKWFFAPGSPVGAPHNLIISELSEAGLIGLAALALFLIVVLRTSRRSSSDLGEAAYLVMVARLLESMLGIFWTAGVGTLPFLVLGLMVGDEDEEVGVARRGARDRGPRVIEQTDEAAEPRLRVLRIYHSAVVGPWRRRDRELRELGVDVVLVSPRRWNEGGQDVDLDLDGDRFVVVARTLGSHPYGFVYDPRPIWRVLRSRPFDVIDVHEEPASLAAAEGWLLARLAGSRAALCLYSAQNLPKRYPAPFRWIERAVLRRAAGVHTCNDAAGDILRSKGFSGVVRDLGLGVDAERFVPADPATMRPPEPELLRVGYVGRLEAHKGVGVLIAAVAATSGMVLEIVGAGPERMALEREAEDAGIAARVSFRGFCDQDGLAEVYRRFDVVVVPSLDTPTWVEQFGRVAVEAMASGAVVVASRSGALPDVVGDAGVLVPPGDVAALADALAQLRDDPGRRAELAAAGPGQASEYAWAAVARRQRDFYRQLDWFAP